MVKYIRYFSKIEFSIWLISIFFISISFCLYDRSNYMALIASLIGVTALIFNAKGNPFGQVLVIVFSILYGVISYTFAYYGEMITYLGMTMPMAILALISWIRNPYSKDKVEVKVNSISEKEMVYMLIGSIVVTILFFYVLKYFNTTNLFWSTVSITTSFVAAYLTFRRSPLFALAYALNDIVLIVMWIMASLSDIHYISVAVCFITFLINDVYGYISWREMKIRQSSNEQ